MKVYNFFPTTAKLQFYNQNVLLGSAIVGPYQYVSTTAITEGVPYTYISVSSYIGMDGYNSNLDKLPNLYYTFANDPNVKNNNSSLVLIYDPDYYSSMNSISSNSSITYKLMRQYNKDFNIVCKDARGVALISKDSNPSFYQPGVYILPIPRSFNPSYVTQSIPYELGSQDNGSSGDCYITAPSNVSVISKPFYANGMSLSGYCDDLGNSCFIGQQLFINISQGVINLNGNKPVTIGGGSYNWMVHRYANIDYVLTGNNISTVTELSFDYGGSTGMEPVMNFLNVSNPLITIFANDPTITDGKLHGFYPKLTPGKKFNIYGGGSTFVATLDGTSSIITDLYNYGTVKVIVAPGPDDSSTGNVTGNLMRYISDNVSDSALTSYNISDEKVQDMKTSRFQGQQECPKYSIWDNFMIFLFILVFIIAVLVVSTYFTKCIIRGSD